MAPSSTLQARIKAFEALGNGSAKDLPDDIAQAAIESRNPLDTDSPRSASAILPIVPQPFSPSPSASPASLATKSSLIDLKDWVIDDGPLLPPRSPPASRRPHAGYDATPLINLEPSPPKSAPKAPPLPPRKPSYTSLRSVSLTTPSVSQGTSTSRSPVSPHMLMPPDLEHTYPPARSPGPDDAPSRRHAPASSISSFHSVSLSSDGGTDPGGPQPYPMDRDWADDAGSLGESYENVSVSTPSEHFQHVVLQKPKGKPGPPRPPASKPLFPPPTKHHPHSNGSTKHAAEPPKLPQRPSARHPGSASSNSLTSPAITPTASGSSSSLNFSASSSAPSLSYTPRRPPPRPPQASSVPSPPRRSSSTHSQSSTRSAPNTARPPPLSLPLTRQAPLPPAARARYDTLFNSTARAADHLRVPGVTKKRANAGWRGLSVDLTTGDLDEKDAPDEAGRQVLPDARLDGRTVRRIWTKSKLPSEKLREIWCVSSLRAVAGC
ncbi:hypothetical protein FA95DRAFT_1567114 [Auriscalpium vulgare]|uniref:Uncharacterized protein n=1 Tax=Auriscalpium vulgare TaxID=40419 RepID=A0ACB8R680_9AGAM|nr:hypothetical protein FA95DRAFT_1567114 [Auriscalpium vulgare]